jgi:hypothetical protein
VNGCKLEKKEVEATELSHAGCKIQNTITKSQTKKEKQIKQQ